MSRILLVDDDIDLAELVKTRLATEGHEVIVTHSGEKAFHLAKETKPDIAILDIMLPGITGYQICRMIRKDPELYAIGILILTALGEEPEILHGLEQGADDYLAKPFKHSVLLEKIASIESLLDAIKRRNPITNLPGTEAIKREINHRLARGSAISSCYIDIVGFKAYAAAYGPEAKNKALQFMAQLLQQIIRQSGVYETFIAHLGGEHFVVLLNLEDYERFTATLIRMFDHHSKSLYQKQDVERGYVIYKDRRGQEKKGPLMHLAIGVAHTQHRTFKSAKKMFEVLAQTRHMAEGKGKSTVFVDRRRTDR